MLPQSSRAVYSQSIHSRAITTTQRPITQHRAMPSVSPSTPETSNMFSGRQSTSDYEKEADHIAENTMRMSPSFIMPRDEAPDPSRQNGHLSSFTSGGVAIPNTTRGFFESRMGRDLSKVRIHQNSTADLATRALGAKAFAIEDHVWLSSKVETQPNMTLAHELAHVLQWQSGAPSTIRADIFDKSLTQQLLMSDFEGLDVETVERLLEAMLVYIENFPEGSIDRQALQENLDMASQALARMTTSEPEPEPTPAERRARRRRLETPDPDTMRRDIQRIMNLVQETHVSDGEEAQILVIIERYTSSQYRFELFLRALDNRHYYAGAFGGYKFRSGVTAVSRELEGPRWRRFRQLLRTHSRSYRDFEPPEELTFGQSFWTDLSEGQIRDQIFAYFHGMGQAGVAMATSFIDMVRDPVGFIRSIGELPQTISTFWRNRRQILNTFMSASPEEQARYIGRLFGEAEIFLATMGSGSTTAPARATRVLAPIPAEAVVASGRGAAAMSGGGGIALDLGRLGPFAQQGMQMTAHSAQLGSGNGAVREVAEEAGSSSGASGSGSTRTRRSPDPDAPQNLTPDEARRLEILEEFADAQSTHRRPDVAPEGTRATGTTTRPRTRSLSDADVLAANLERTVATRPPGHHAHHMIPKGMREAGPAREILERFNIGINSERNGVWLASEYGVPNVSTGQIHSTIHTRRYVRWLNEQLIQASHGGRAGVLDALASIRSQILNGSVPL
ncbi:DUF4157 domain-containing protein [Enterovibrio calviensis]|uniref:eCIS core domain-containing protein n=1 Tax=Enterovibrio calviensis TaxID=91359 RepID=UPI003736F3BA